MQIEIVYSLWIAFVVAGFAFIFYLFAKTCKGGPGSGQERRGGVPREGDLTSTSAAYGAEASYSPGMRGSSAGPFPVGGRQDRPPTRSFRSYTSPRREENKEE